MTPSQALTHRARETLTVVSRAYPLAWQQVDQLRTAAAPRPPSWPEWCFLPLRAAHTIVAGHPGRRLPYLIQHHPSLLGALAAWRVTQGIYRFDPDIYQALVRTPLTGDLPRDPLYRLPEWCVYIETPGLQWPIAGEERPVHGAWAHLDLAEPLEVPARAELRLVLDTARTPAEALDPQSGCIPIPLMGTGTIAESLEQVLSFGLAEARIRGIQTPPQLADSRTIVGVLWPVLSLLLYLCTESGEIGDGLRRPSNPQPKRTRHGWRLFPAEHPANWEVGVRMGSALRRATDAYAARPAGPCTGRHLRPHMRGFHWHTFLAGAHRVERRVKWLAPIKVNVKDPDQLPAVIKCVR